MKLTDRRLWQSGIAILEDNIFEKKLLPEGSTIVEKRKDARVSVSVPLRYRVKNKSSFWENVDAVDVSNSGVRLSLTGQVTVGAHIELEVHLPETKKRIHHECFFHGRAAGRPALVGLFRREIRRARALAGRGQRK